MSDFPKIKGQTSRVNSHLYQIDTKVLAAPDHRRQDAILRFQYAPRWSALRSAEPSTKSELPTRMSAQMQLDDPDEKGRTLHTSERPVINISDVETPVGGSAPGRDVGVHVRQRRTS